MRHLEFVEQRRILLEKRLARVVSLLVLDVTDDRGQVGMRIGKRAETFLPIEASNAGG